jgi:hypothetical protein
VLTGDEVVRFERLDDRPSGPKFALDACVKEREVRLAAQQGERIAEVIRQGPGWPMRGIVRCHLIAPAG